MIKRGWYCKAAVKLRVKNSRNNYNYYIQFTMWKDKKQVMFLFSKNVGHSIGLTESRQAKCKKHPETIPSLHAQADCVENFNTIDRNDQDSADYSMTIWMNCYYI